MYIFPRFNDLFIPDSIKTSKKWESQLEKDAIKWFKESFYGDFDTNKEREYRWYYSGGILIFDIKGCGGFYFKNIIKASHFQFWETEAFTKGYSCDEEGYFNPYPKENFFEHKAFDSGRAMRIYKFKFDFKN